MAKLGRPPLDPTDSSVKVTVSLPSRQLKAAETEADRYHQTVQDWIRRLVKTHIPTDFSSKK